MAKVSVQEAWQQFMYARKKEYEGLDETEDLNFYYIAATKDGVTYYFCDLAGKSEAVIWDTDMHQAIEFATASEAFDFANSYVHPSRFTKIDVVSDSSMYDYRGG